MDALSLLMSNGKGVYNVFIQPMEFVLKNIGKHFDFLLHGYVNKLEIYKYALGYLGSTEAYVEMEIQASYHGCLSELETFTKCCTNYYGEVIPAEFLNSQCFTLLDIVEINTGLLMLSFTCDVPKEYAESEYGIDFKQLDGYFQPQGS